MAASKKKKEKAKDFAKANFKLGKGKLKSANATDTSFSSRSIALTQQSITRDNEGVPTTKRNLTLEDLQTQLKHYSSSTRKDALAGLRELFSSYPHLQEESAGTLIPLLARMIGDEEQSVRKSLLAFLSWYLPGLPPIVLQPHHSVLLFFATSSMSHIYPDIRMDAVRALNIMLDIFPESIVLPWFGGSSNSGTHTEEDLPNKVLECYLSLLHIRSGIASNGLRTDMSPAAKALVLSSLATFIRLSTAPEGPRALVHADERALPSVPTWFLAPAFPTRRAYDSFIEQIGAGNHPSPRFSVDYPAQTGCLMDGSSILDQDSHIGLAQIGNIFTELNANGTAMENAQALPSTPEQLLKILLPILISAFLDSGPTAFSPEAAAAPSTSTAQENALTTIIAVADISRDLWRSILLHDLHRNASNRAELASSMEKMITHMAVYFPFGHDELTKRSMSDATKLQSLNITFCELVALVGISSRRPSANQSHEGGTTGMVQSKGSRSKNKTEGALLAMSKYVTSLLGSAKSHSILTSGTTVTPQMYIQLLPTIWSLLAESSPATEDEDILRVLIRHFLDLSSTSGVKKLAFISISRLLMLPDACPSVRLQSYGRRLYAIKNSKLHEEFLTALPRYLWELGTKDQELSLSITAFLRHVITTGSPSEAVIETLATFLAPYYTTNHPKRGLLSGPWTSINNEGAVHSLEATWWLSSHTSTNASKTLQTAVQGALDARASQDLSQRWASLTAGVTEV